MVKIKSVQRVNPQDVEAPKKFYALAVADGQVDLERLAYLVSNQCTVRESDCYAVLKALQHNIIDELSQGRIVKLDGIGNFQVGIKSESTDEVANFSAQLVKKAHLNFRPAKRLRDMLANVQFKVVTG